MSTFAVFGMTRDVALAEAKKRVKTSKPGKAGGPSIQLTPAQWDEAVAKYADKLMSGEKVKQLSNLFDAPPVRAAVHRTCTQAGGLPRPSDSSPLRAYRRQGQPGDQPENQDAKNRMVGLRRRWKG
ncbi:hypothetical protein [Pseudomonas putida]|uniref:hypothetical protein n=1 Tax=Pseudomonas putida TaxID=303 RepID=UPI00235CE786|nr:hypothetical protein [Pseudomonas putida]GLO44217.1 hypothetical protein PPUN109347_07790 [Pseudomonas putida]